jgi:hypothetical protein
MIALVKAPIRSHVLVEKVYHLQEVEKTLIDIENAFCVNL